MHSSFTRLSTSLESLLIIQQGRMRAAILNHIRKNLVGLVKIKASRLIDLILGDVNCSFIGAGAHLMNIHFFVFNSLFGPFSLTIVNL